MWGRAFVGGALVVGVAALGGGCGLVANLSGEYVAGDAGSGNDGGGGNATLDAQDDTGSGAGSNDGSSGDAAADQDASGGAPCVSNGGAAMVRVTIGGATYCIDTAEVTEADYTLFLAAAGTPAQQAECAWNKSFDPEDIGGGECDHYMMDHLARPVVCVDWCDGKAYCESVGKRLCGAIGGGAITTLAQVTDPTKDQWQGACSSTDASRIYPYGSTYTYLKCNDSAAESADVKSHAACVGATPGLFDMSGNAAEWEDACDTAGGAPDQNCKTRGGDFGMIGTDVHLQCAQPVQAPRKSTTKHIGFRCCSD